MHISYSSLKEVWGPRYNLEDDMNKYKASFKPNKNIHAQPYEQNSNDEYAELVKLYSEKSNEAQPVNIEPEQTNTAVEENFNVQLPFDDDDNSDIILLVILGIFIIFILDSMLKIKISV